jgi:2-iminobutanoate/2-iminopropanoate deaminase
MAGDYLYVSGQGARDANGQLPATVEAQTRQCLQSIKAIVEAAGLTMDHVVYTHVYLTDISQYSAMNSAYAEFFHGVLPARSTMGVIRMPLDTPVEISAIAVRDLSLRQSVAMGATAKSPVPLSAGIQTPDRLFLAGILGRNSETGVTPDTPAGQIEIALKRLRDSLSAAKSDARHLVYLNVYRTPAMPRELLESELQKAVPAAAISVVDVSTLPFGVSVGITAVATRDLKAKRVYKEGKETLCASAGETVYCAARSGASVTEAFAAIEKGLKSLGSSLDRAVANTVYIDDIANFQTMNQAYALSFPAPAPTRTTVQPMPAGGQARVAVVAVK